MSEPTETRTTERHEGEGAGPAGSDIRFLKERKRRSSKAIVLALLVLTAAVAYAWFARAALRTLEMPAEVQNSGLLVDRIWIDKVPERDTDTFTFYVFSSEENLALNDKAASTYRHLLEIFFYRATARDLQYQFPHDRRNGKTPYTVEKLARPDQHQLDLRLTIQADPQQGGETKIYYSSTKWSSLDRSTLPAPLRAALAQVPRLP